MPVHKGRKVMSSATKPWGEQWEYITEVKRNGIHGHWIARDSYLAKKNQRLQKVESSAKDADLILYYIHGLSQFYFTILVCGVTLFEIGGGFRVGDSLMYTESFKHIVDHLKSTRGMNVRIFSINYGMFPEAKYTQSKEDCIQGYRYLVEDLKINPKRIVFGK